jgi:cysteine desulfurase
MNSSVKSLRNYFWESLKSTFGDSVVLNGSLQNSLPNTLSIGFINRSGTQILSRIPVLAASTGSACHSGQELLSSTLKAMGVSTQIGLGTIRFSLGIESTKHDIDETLHLLKSTIAHSQ